MGDFRRRDLLAPVSLPLASWYVTTGHAVADLVRLLNGVVLLAGVGDQFFPYAGEYAHFMDLSPAYRFSWTADRSNNRLHIMLQVNLRID